MAWSNKTYYYKEDCLVRRDGDVNLAIRGVVVWDSFPPYLAIEDAIQWSDLLRVRESEVLVDRSTDFL